MDKQERDDSFLTDLASLLEQSLSHVAKYRSVEDRTFASDQI